MDSRLPCDSTIRPTGPNGVLRNALCGTSRTTEALALYLFLVTVADASLKHVLRRVDRAGVQHHVERKPLVALEVPHYRDWPLATPGHGDGGSLRYVPRPVRHCGLPRCTSYMPVTHKRLRPCLIHRGTLGEGRALCATVHAHVLFENAHLPKPPTIRDIAEQLGVSIATVSLSMHGNTRIPKRTRDRVIAAMRESGYVYQRSAAAMRTSTTHTVGVILNNVTDPFFGTLLASLDEALARTGRSLFLCNSNESVARQSEFIRKMSEHNADGIIVCPAIDSTAEDFNVGNAPVPPIVLVSRPIVGLDVDHVVNDDFESGRLATQRLLDLGHRRIAVVGGLPSIACFETRLRAYRETLESAGVAFDEALVIPCVPRRVPGFEAAATIASLSPPPTAVICYNDLIALGLLLGLPRHGLYPGRNFAVIGHEDIEESRLMDPALSVTTVQIEKMGRTAAEVLLERLADPDGSPRQVVLETELLARETCNYRIRPHP